MKEDIRNLEKAGCRISGRTRKKTVHYDGLVGFVVTNRGNLERETGFEPATACLEGRGSTTELLPHRGEILEGGGGWGQGSALVRQVSDTPGFYSVVGFRFAFCLLGFGLAMKEALLPSNWLCISLCGCSGCRGDLESRPRLRGRDLQPAVPSCWIICTDRSRAGCPSEAPLLGLCAASGTSGPEIQVWPHSLTICVLVCRSGWEQILRHPLAVAR